MARELIAILAITSLGRTALNWYYRTLDPKARQSFHSSFARIFRDRRWPVQSGEWELSFAGRSFKVPLRRESMWHDWDASVSIVGNDVEIKVTYERLLQSPLRPEIFIDIGANYGTHSILFLLAGVPTVSIEPNSQCRDWFTRMCALNGLEPQWCNFALGENNGMTRLAFPERDTWFGATASETQAELQRNHRLTWMDVPVKKLDELADRLGSGAALIKIDVEGAELPVLHGGANYIRTAKPLIIFENNHFQRKRMHRFFGGLDYRLYNLPWNPDRPALGLLDEAGFESSAARNFIAIYAGSV
jgi:FkbM family methyltransferase